MTVLLSFRGMDCSVLFLANQALQRVAQLGGGAFDGQVQGFGLVGDRDRIMVLQARLDLAALVLRTALAGVFVVEMDLQTSQVIVEAGQGADRKSTRLNSSH